MWLSQKTAMFRRGLAGAVVYGVLVVASTSVLAAGPLVRVDAGEVLVNTGDGFKAVANGSALAPGSQVLASPNAVAAIIYPDGSIVPVKPGAMIYVNEAVGVTSTTTVSEWQTAVAPGQEEVPGQAPAPGGLPNSTLLMIAGIGAAAGGVVAIASGNGSGGSSPASP